MELNKIRNMSDDELLKFLKQLSNRGTKFCLKCNKPTAFVIKIENQDTFQTKKLCGLCEDCYQQLLDTLSVYDIDWEK